MKNSLVIIIICFMFLSCNKVVDIREKLLNSSKRIKGFPRGKLTQFAYIGFVDTKDGKIYVVFKRSVLTGMLAPRGLGETMFFNHEYKYLGSYSLAHWPLPLWCKKGHLYFFGRSTWNHIYSKGKKNNGNALDLSRGWQSREWVDIYEYGSSGGVNDHTTDEKRKEELLHWDSK